MKNELKNSSFFMYILNGKLSEIRNTNVTKVLQYYKNEIKKGFVSLVLCSVIRYNFFKLKNNKFNNTYNYL
jgi:mevalonate pyrophosphate decarboxylase